MDRRFVTFLILSFFVLLLNSLWLASRRPHPAPGPDRQALAKQQGPKQQGPETKGPAGQGKEADSTPQDALAKREQGKKNKPAGDSQVPSPNPKQGGPEPKTDKLASGTPPVESTTGEGPDRDQAAAQRQPGGPPVGEPMQDDKPLRYVTLGSVDADSSYRQLVTLTSQGAGVRRIELASPRYRDLQDRSGYLGHLECVDDPAGGARVRVVGQGTPAAAAGLQLDDRIVAAGVGEMKKVKTAGNLRHTLAASRPGQTLSMQVQRQGSDSFECAALLGRRPLEVVRPEVENVLLWADKLPKEQVGQPSFLLTLQQLGQEVLGPEAEKQDQQELAHVALRTSNWETVKQDNQSVTFRKQLAGRQCEILKRYRLASVPAKQHADQDYPAYSLKLEVEIRNLAPQARAIAYRLDGPGGLPMEGWWYANKIGRSWGAAGIRDVMARSEGGETVQFSPSKVIDDKVPPMEGNPLAYVGVDAQYFTAMLLPEKSALEDRWISETRAILLSPKPSKPAERRYANVSCRLISNAVQIAPGASLRHTYRIFAGPKRTELLAHYQAAGNPRYSLSNLQYYGWFSGVAKAMLWILHFFYAIVRNYGLAIIMLTVLVRACMFPISRKQAVSMAKMQELKPEMDRLKEKYKGDMQKQSQATQELYRKYKINPMAGCLPMVIQLPIFVGLYRSLMVDVELRQAPLLSESIRWCSNLAAPDMFYDWSSFMPHSVTCGVGILGLGPYLNMLPLVTVCLFILQQKLFMPEAANEQAAMQQKIMKYMMVFMGLMFFKVAAGLCLYFIASSSWGIAERKLISAAKLSGSKAGTSPAAGSVAVAKREVPGRTASRNGKAQGRRQARRKR